MFHNRTEARDYFKLSADQGNANGQYWYGICLRDGTGTSENQSEAAKYFKLSADEGYPPAQYDYGRCLLNARGVSRNVAEASRYFKLSADSGNHDGQFMFGICLLRGYGVARNTTGYYHYLKLSGKKYDEDLSDCDPSDSTLLPRNATGCAEQVKPLADAGDPVYQFTYGAMRFLKTPAQNLQESAIYFKLSADQGLADGQLSYGRCLLKGLGIAKNESEAVRYLKLAAD
jgi:TPR repeat protein